ncbi:MAG: hypothetical protein ACOC80_10180 [Petrotogales bacterium]
MVISIIEQIKQLEKVLIPRYEITKRHFEVGDTVVSLVTGDEIPDLAEVVEVQDFGGDDGCVYYWVRSESVSYWEYLWLRIKALIFKHPWIPLKFGPGHAVEAGSEIFKTVEEARMAMHFNETLSGLYRIRNMLEEEGFDVNSNILNGEDCGGET